MFCERAARRPRQHSNNAEIPHWLMEDRMPGGLKSDIKLGFGIAIGLVLLGFALMILQVIIGKVKG